MTYHAGAIRKRMLLLLFVSLVPIILYFIYAFVINNINPFIFKVLISLWLVIYLICFDALEPYILKQFDNITIDQKKSYLTYLALDVLGVACLAYIVFTMGDTGSDMTLYAAFAFVIAARSKLKYKKEFLGMDHEVPIESKDHKEDSI